MKSDLFTDFDENYDHALIQPPPQVNNSWADSFANDEKAMSDFPLFVRRERFRQKQTAIHCHIDFCALLVVRAGRGVRAVNGITSSLARGDIFLMAPGACHSWRETLDLTVDGVYFQPSLWDQHTWSILLQMPDLASHLNPSLPTLEPHDHNDHFGHLSPEPHSRVEAVFKEMREEFNSMKVPLRLSARARLLTLLIQLAQWRENKTLATRPAKGAGIAEVLEFCEANFHRPITNAQLAAMMNFCEAHFRDVFLQEVGTTPGAYLRHLRLQHSQKLLADNKMPIADVARMSGFSSATYFGQAFQMRFAISPREFRKQNRTARKG
ncbi:AraC family transcriptional regulator [bacterium]|nr:MAG: AraC family transcriptional regulator [bacterium]